MPGTFWLALILFVVSLLAVGVALFSREKGVLGVAALFFGFGLVFTLVASANTVPVRNVGIVTSFNKPTGETTGSGLKWVAPWKKVGEWDASVQNSTHTGDWGQGCITVRIGSMATACVENRTRWQVIESGAPSQFMDYKGEFENMKNNLFEAELQNALNDTFADYNPLAQIDVNTGETKFDGAALSTELTEKLKVRVGSQITIHSVVIPLIHHDKTTEENIKKFQDVIAQKRILVQANTNANQEKANADLLKSLPMTYLINKCLDQAKESGKEPGLCLSQATLVRPIG